MNLPHFARDWADGEELLRLQPEAAAAAAAANTAFVRNFPRSVTCARPPRQVRSLGISGADLCDALPRERRVTSADKTSCGGAAAAVAKF